MAAEPTANLKDRAEDDLRFIRDAMGRGAAFTCVPGRGGVAMGAVGTAAAVLAPWTGSPRAWLAVGSYALLPAVWLLFYGCAVVGAGVSSVPAVPLFGGSLVAFGLAATLLPAAGDVLLGLGFGAGHVATGLVVARRHGG